MHPMKEASNYWSNEYGARKRSNPHRFVHITGHIPGRSSARIGMEAGTEAPDETVA